MQGIDVVLAIALGAALGLLLLGVRIIEMAIDSFQREEAPARWVFLLSGIGVGVVLFLFALAFAGGVGQWWAEVRLT